MEKFLESILFFFSNKTYSVGTKALFTVTGIILLGIIDHIFGFSYHFSINNKLQHIDKIENMKMKYYHNDTLILYLNNIENEIMNNKSNYVVLDFSFPSLDFSSPDKSLQIDHKLDNIPNSTQTIITKPKIIRSSFWHLLTTSFFWLITALILPFTMFANQRITGSIIGACVAALLVLAIIVSLYYYLLGLIPVIANRPWINYLINLTVHGLSLWLLFVIVKRQKK